MYHNLFYGSRYYKSILACKIKRNHLLDEDGQFTFIFSALSSYIGYGPYTIEGTQLHMKTDDQLYTYLFDIKDKTLVFNADSSSEIHGLTLPSDGAIFK